jgi:2,4-dienoyl-CoA reductase [(3E)-enoyl-CoA-producing], peroxisomal
VNELGGIDFVIAGAAGNFLAPVTQLSANAFKTVIDIDVLGSYNAMKVCLPHVIKSAEKHKVDGVTGGKSSLYMVPFLLSFSHRPLIKHCHSSIGRRNRRSYHLRRQ